MPAPQGGGQQPAASFIRTTATPGSMPGQEKGKQTPTHPTGAGKPGEAQLQLTTLWVTLNSHRASYCTSPSLDSQAGQNLEIMRNFSLPQRLVEREVVEACDYGHRHTEKLVSNQPVLVNKEKRNPHK